MAEFNILRTNHTGIIVSDLDRSITFFRDALGFEVTSRAPRDPTLIRSITGVEGADVVAILTEWAEFATLDLGRLRGLLRQPIVVDLRNLYDPAEMADAGLTYHSIGR